MITFQAKPSLYRDFFLLSALIVLVLLVASIWVIYQTHQSHSEDILQQLENEAIRIDRVLIIEIEQASYLLESVGRQINVNGYDLDSQALRIFESFAGNQPLQGGEFYWINADQELVISSNGGRLEKPVNISDRDYMKRAITTPWKIHIGQPVEGRVSQEWGIPVAMGLTDDEGNFRGAVSVSVNIEILSRAISNVIKNPKIDFAITNTAFTLLTEMAETPDFFARYFSLGRLSKIDFEETSNGVFSTASWLESDNIYAYYEQSSQYPYIIFVGYNPESSQAAIDNILLPRLAQIAILSLVLVLTLWTVRKRIIQPVMLLTQHTNDILHGKPFNHDASRDPVEIEQLSEAIERLGAYIQERKHIEAEMAAKNSELVKIKEAAETTNHLKATFFERVGEALMQPAKSISEHVDSMRDELFGPLGNDKYIEMAETIYQESAALMETLGDIQAISEAESGLLALNEAPIDLEFVIKKCVRLMREVTPYQHLDIILDLDETIPKIRADELRIKQLILNLLSNAANEIGNNDVLRLNTYQSADEIRIELTYKPLPLSQSRSDSAPPSLAQHSRSAMQAPGFLKLGHALSELIIAMHGGSISTKALPDQMIKKIVTIPSSRML